MSYKSKRWELAAPTLIKNFEKRGMEACYCENSKEALKKVLSLIPKGSSVTFGGSETLNETGIFEAQKASGQHFAGHPALPACARCRKSARCAVLRRTGADLHAGTRPRQAAWQQNGLRNEGEKQDGTYCS